MSTTNLSDFEVLLTEIEQKNPDVKKIKKLMKKQALSYSKTAPEQLDAILKKLSFLDEDLHEKIKKSRI